MFQISDVMIDKDEVAMSLNIHIQMDEETEEGSVSENSSGVSKSHTEILIAEVLKLLKTQGVCKKRQKSLLHKAFLAFHAQGSSVSYYPYPTIAGKHLFMSVISGS